MKGGYAMALFESIFDEAYDNAKRDSDGETTRHDSTPAAMKAKYKLWREFAIIVRDLSDDERGDVATSTVNVMKSFTVMCAIGFRDMADKMLDTLEALDKGAVEDE